MEENSVVEVNGGRSSSTAIERTERHNLYSFGGFWPTKNAADSRKLAF